MRLTLHLSPDHAKSLADDLRNEGWDFLAEEIESQLPKPRIPEPDLWGVVESRANGLGGHRGHFVRIKSCDGAEWFCSKNRAHYRWVDLVDPVLIREGI